MRFFCSRISNEPYFAPILGDLPKLLDPSTFVGRAPEQVDEFLKEEVAPVLKKYEGKLEGKAEFKL